MSKVTSKLQVTLPKRIAERHGITPGDEIDFESAGEAIRIVTRKRRTATELSVAERLRLFDAATARQARLAEKRAFPQQHTDDRDWTREDLYTRGPTD
jgi:AbrB family looped-hinge helix DNA binding protein